MIATEILVYFRFRTTEPRLQTKTWKAFRKADANHGLSPQFLKLL